MSQDNISRTSINLMHNQLKNASMHKLENAPENPVEGQFYYSTDEKKPYYFDGVDWIALEDKKFVYEQTTPSKIWEYEHNLGKKPSVQVTDSAGTVMMGQVTVNDGVRVRIEFNIAFWGYATNN